MLVKEESLGIPTFKNKVSISACQRKKPGVASAYLIPLPHFSFWPFRVIASFHLSVIDDD